MMQVSSGEKADDKLAGKKGGRGGLRISINGGGSWESTIRGENTLARLSWKSSTYSSTRTVTLSEGGNWVFCTGRGAARKE